MDKKADVDALVRKIFSIIPSYYNEREAGKIRQLILEYISGRCFDKAKWARYHEKMMAKLSNS